MSEKQLLQVSRDGGIAVITLDNPAPPCENEIV
jgi:hypothetical protein